MGDGTTTRVVVVLLLSPLVVQIALLLALLLYFSGWSSLRRCGMPLLVALNKAPPLVLRLRLQRAPSSDSSNPLILGEKLPDRALTNRLPQLLRPRGFQPLDPVPPGQTERCKAARVPLFGAALGNEFLGLPVPVFACLTLVEFAIREAGVEGRGSVFCCTRSELSELFVDGP